MHSTAGTEVKQTEISTEGSKTESQDEKSEELGFEDRSCAQPSESKILQTDEPLPSEDRVADQFPFTKEELIALQEEDPDIKFVIELRKRFKQKPDWKEVEGKSSTVKTLWFEFERLDIRNEMLCRKWTPLRGNAYTWQVIIPKKLRLKLVRMVHVGITGGHLGRSKTENQVQRRAYWPGWRNDVASEVKKCEECARYFRGNPTKKVPLHPFFSGEPFEVISIDITGRHPRSHKGNEYIVTIVDVFSKWSEAIPVRRHTAQVVAKVLLENIICRFGTPLRILSDQGREFDSELFRDLCFRLEVDKVRTTAYQPSTNECVERFHRTLNSMLAKVIAENQRDWDEHLPAVMAAYRSARHESTGFTPNFLIFGRENRAPLDLVLGPIEDEESGRQERTYDDFVQRQMEIYQEAYRVAQEQLGVAAQKRKFDYDLGVKKSEFQPGDWVWYYYPRRYQHRSPKWSKNYCGPFLVIKRIPPSDYIIQKTRRSMQIVVHANKLKLYTGVEPPSWPHSEQQATEHEQCSSSDPPGESSAGHRPKATRLKPRLQQHDDQQSFEDFGQSDRLTGKRQRKTPRWLMDYEY